MPWWLPLAIGVGLIVLGVILTRVQRGLAQKSRQLRDIPPYEVAALAGQPSGLPVVVTGTLRCDHPLKAEISGQLCAYYEMSVVRESESEERDSAGKTRRTRDSETVASNRQAAAFAIEDATGRVVVRPDGAEFDARQVVSRFEPVQSGGSITIGGFHFNPSSESNTIGYRSTEKLLPVDAPILVLGVLHETGEIGAPAAGETDRQFLISYRSAAELARSYSRQAGGTGVAAKAAIGIGALLLIAGGLLWIRP